MVPLPVNRFPNKLSPKVPDSILGNSLFCSFASFLIVSLIHFINNPDSSRAIFMILFISSLEIISVIKPDLNIALWIAAFVADAAGGNPNGIRTLLANGLTTIKGNLAFSIGPKSLPNNVPDCPILQNWVFESFILADEPFAKALRIFEIYVLVNGNL